ncbi:MAG: hypothetical protein JSV62_04825 [Promethearchaeota archaeon]|nr:MAG: hypothetical protein JSV62_04825 [Candidatus Lokiarchaeota archaeon]
MESITHNLAAVLIQILCFNIFFYPLNIIFTIIFAFLSHFLSDAFSKLTYHTPEAMKNDKFWITWHIIIYTASIVTFIIFFLPFWLGMLFVNLPDIIDWFILRPIKNKKKRESPDAIIKKNYSMHQISDWIRIKILFWLPDLTYKKYGVITELIMIGFFSSLIYLFI